VCSSDLEILSAGEDPKCAACASRIAYMIDQSHCIEPKIPAMIRSALNVQTAYAKALLINRPALRAAQAANDVMAAEACVREAFEQDVAPLLVSVREEMGVPADPIAAYALTGYEDKIASRKPAAGWE
jgi:L-rhamnose isomerase/sugar isomerase